MVFTIEGKVALITGGASGIGFHYARELLRNGLKVTLADVNIERGNTAIRTLEEEFGQNRAIFVKTDVTDYLEFEEAFRKTIEAYGQIDILINNAGILNDFKWELEIDINLKGVINGMILGMDKYLPKYQEGPEALIVNISSIAGIMGSGHVPVYTATKHGVIGATKSWGNSRFYNHKRVRVVAVCPGVTMTPLITEMNGRSLGPLYENFVEEVNELSKQEPSQIAEEVINVIKYAPNGTVWVIEGGEPAFEFKFPDKNTMKNNRLPIS